MKFSPDAPIDKPKDDRLNRKQFAIALSRSLQYWHENDSLVVGLFGGWGSGKSSLKNLALHELKKANNPPTIVQFNPWLISRQEQLVEGFFRDVTVTLSLPTKGEAAEKAEKRMSKLASYFSMFGTVTEHTLDMLSIAGVPGAAIGAAVAKATNKMGGVIQEGSDTEKRIAESAKKTLYEIKNDLRETLNEREGSTVVIIDDIDRLTRDEICLLFRLIKANADFPKFIYLVLCDRIFVTDALENLAPKRGAEFLEKIVQVSFDVPQPSWEHVIDVARQEWQSILATSRDADRRADKARYDRFVEIAKPYICYIRSVRRWMNAVRFSFGIFTTRSGFDANPEDVLALELIRVFEPLLYEALARSKTELTYDGWDFKIPSRDSEAKNEAVKNMLLETVSAKRQSTIVSLLDWMFPYAKWKDSRQIDPALFSGLRVCESRCFNRYFQFSLGRETYTRREIKKLLKASENYEAFYLIIKKAYKLNRLELALDHLYAHSRDVFANIKNIIQVLFDIGDEFPVGGGTYRYKPAADIATSFIAAFLGTISKQDQREIVLEDTIRASRGALLPFLVMYNESYADYRNRKTEQSLLVSNNKLPVLQKAVLEKIKEHKNLPAFVNKNIMWVLLQSWKDWESVEEPKQWLCEKLIEREILLNFLRMETGMQISGAERKYVKTEFGWVGQYISVDQLDSFVQKISREEISDEEKELLTVYDTSKDQYLQTLQPNKRKKKGPPSGK